MTVKDISIIRGDTYSFNINFKDSNDDPIDITGWTIYFTIRQCVAPSSTVSDADAILSKQFTNGGVPGTVTIDLTAIDTNQEPEEYKYDIQYKKPDGTIRSTGIYNFIITEDITRSS